MKSERRQSAFQQQHQQPRRIWERLSRGPGGRRPPGDRRTRTQLVLRSRRRLVVILLLGVVIVSAYVWPSIMRRQLPSRKDERTTDDDDFPGGDLLTKVEGGRQERELEPRKEEGDAQNDHSEPEREPEPRKEEGDAQNDRSEPETLSDRPHTGVIRVVDRDLGPRLGTVHDDEKQPARARPRSDDVDDPAGVKKGEDRPPHHLGNKAEKDRVDQKKGSEAEAGEQERRGPGDNDKKPALIAPKQVEGEPKKADATKTAKKDVEGKEEGAKVALHPIFGRRRLLDRYEDLLSYVSETSERGLGRIDVWEMLLTQEEMDLNSEAKMFRDMSGRYPSVTLARCLACADANLYKSALRTDVLCKNGGKSSLLPPFCHGPRRTREGCLEEDRYRREEQRRGGGWFKGDFDSKKRNPYLVRFRGGAFVTTHGQIYNDDAVYDFRGGCRRAPLPPIFPDVARERKRFKKVYVIDHVWPGIHHELAEAGGQLTGYYKELMEDPSIFIHTSVDDNWARLVSNKNKHDLKPRKAALDVLETFGINRSRVVGGDVYAEEEVVVAEGYCYYAQWLYGLYASRLRKVIRQRVRAAAAMTKRERDAAEGIGGANNGVEVRIPANLTEGNSRSSSSAFGGGSGNGVMEGREDGRQQEKQGIQRGDGRQQEEETRKMEEKQGIQEMVPEDDGNGEEDDGKETDEGRRKRRNLLRETVDQPLGFVSSALGGGGSVNEGPGSKSRERRGRGLAQDADNHNHDEDDNADGGKTVGTTILLIKRKAQRRIANHDEFVEELSRVVAELNEAAIAGTPLDATNTVGRATTMSSPPPSSFSASSSSSSSVDGGVAKGGLLLGFPLKLEVYDDSKTLSQVEIWTLFASAGMIIGPHGAGFTNVLAAKPRTLVYEIIEPPSFHHADPSMYNFCYQMMSFALGLDYHCDFPEEMQSFDFAFNITTMKWSKQHSYMVIDAARVARNVKAVLLDRMRGEY